MQHPKSWLIVLSWSFRVILPKCELYSSLYLGETKTTVSPYIIGGVSDGQWHMVEVHYYNKVPSTNTSCILFCFVFLFL